MWREFFADLRAQKLRTSLTVLGIAWGTVAVVVLLAFGVGLERQTRKRFHGLGDRIVILWGGRTTRPLARAACSGALPQAATTTARTTMRGGLREILARPAGS